ncbi:MAG: enoyl-CoA hydratase [Phenylobacterium sp.]|nr:enoyl-CoA hydratase [Phenylobacterium sp.]
MATEMSADALLGGSQAPLHSATVGDVRILVLNRPEVRNALSLEVRQAFARSTQEAEADPDIKALIITGAHGVFSAGVDLKERAAGPPQPMFRPHPAEAARAVTKPFIAAIDGPCVTGALELALSCSFLIASDRARFADTHAKVGLFPGWGQSALLASAIGVRRARQLSLTGAFIDAEMAFAWGLVNEITTPENLLPRALEICAQASAANERSVRMQLELYAQHDGVPFEAALAAEYAAADRWRAGREAQTA